MSLQGYQLQWQQDQNTQTGQKIQRNQSILESLQNKKLQIGQSTLIQQKGQKDITFLSAILKDSAGIVETKANPNHYQSEFDQLMNLCNKKANPQQNKQKQIENDKQIIFDNQKKEIENAKNLVKICQQKTTNINQGSYSVFGKSQKQLEEKLKQIGNFNIEENDQNTKIAEFNYAIQNLNFNSLESVQKLLNQINNQVNGRNDADDRQQNSVIRNNNYNPSVSRIRNELLYGNLNNIPDKKETQQNKKYTLNDIVSFFSNIKCNSLDDMFELSFKIEGLFQNLNSNFEEISKQIKGKNDKIGQLVGLYEEFIKKFFTKLPLDYFQKEGDKILDHFGLLKYEQLSQLTNLKNKVEAFSISLSSDDLKRLQPDQLINDNLLECYSLYLSYSHQFMKNNKSQYKSQYEGDVIIFTQLFFESLFDGMTIRQEDAKRYINNIVPIDDLFNLSIVNRFGFIINVELYSIKHWIFFGVFNETRDIVYYDSAGSSNNYFKNISEALKRFFNQAGGGFYNIKKYEQCPHQGNGVDCGMFVMKFMQNFAYGSEQQFTQAQVTTLRKKLYTFFPLLSYQLENDCLDFDMLQYYEDRFSRSEKLIREI